MGDIIVSQVIWKIENFSCSIPNFTIQSPVFYSISSSEELTPTLPTSWNIVLRMQEVGVVFLVQDLSNSHMFNSLHCSLKFLDSSLKAISVEEMRSFNGSAEFYIQNIGRKINKGNILIVQCHIRESGDTSLGMPIFALTRICTTEKRHDITLDNIHSFEPRRFRKPLNDQLCTYIEFEIIDNEKLHVKFKTDESLHQIQASFEISAKSSQRIVYGSLSRLLGKEIQNFDTYITKRNLIKYNTWTPDDDKLHFVLTCTLRKVEFSKLVKKSEALRSPEPTPRVRQVPKLQLYMSQSNSLFTAETLQKMLGGYASDFLLKVGQEQFPAHKVILGMRSHVFRDMFDTKMKERETGCVDIKDFDSDTVERMLKFLYLGTVDSKMDAERCMRLYAIAHLYRIEPLVEGCAAIVKLGLSVGNVFEVLEFSDLYEDGDLRLAALDFASRNMDKIDSRDEFDKLKKRNMGLAIETFRELFLT